jgi:MFS family permease
VSIQTEQTTADANADGEWPKPRVAWYAVVVLAVCYAFAILDRSILSLLVVPIERDMGINDTQMSLLSGLAFGLFYATLGVPIGWLADRTSRRNIVAVGIALWSLATAACGLAQSFTQLFFSRMAVGVGEATLGPSASSMIADLFAPKDRPKAFGIYVMGTSFGTGLSALMAALVISAMAAHGDFELPVIGTVKPWQAVFFLVGLPGLLVAALVMTVPEPKRRGLLTQSGKASLMDVLRFMRQRPLAYATIFLGPMLIIMAIYGSIAWTATFFIRTHGWTPQFYGYVSAPLSTTAGLISALTSGYVTSYFSRRDKHTGPLMTILLGVIGSAVLHFIMPFSPNGTIAFTFSFLGSFFANWPSAAAFTGLNQITPNEMRAQVTALYNLTIGLSGLTLGPLMVGVLTDYVFKDPTMVGYSLGVTYAVCGILGTSIILIGRSAFGQASRAVSWESNTIA